MIVIVVALLVMLTAGIAVAFTIIRRRSVGRPRGVDVGLAIGAMASNIGIQWAAIYERLNPSGDPQVKQMLDEFRLSGYQLNARLGLNVIEASFDAIAKERGQARRAAITVQEVLAQAMKQHERVAGRWQ